MRHLFTLTILAFGLASAPSVANASCRASARGTYSFDTSLRSRMGRSGLFDVLVFEGATCGPRRARWGIIVESRSLRRMVVTDRGRLISLLARRASHQDWDIVRMFSHEGIRNVVRTIRLEQLPGLPAETRRLTLSLARRQLRVHGERRVIIAVATLEELVRRNGRRRLHRPRWR